MNCDNAYLAISALLDGELTEQEALELEQHLAQCPHCRALREELSALHDACGRWDVQAPSQLKGNVLGHLPAQESVRKAKVISPVWRRWGALAAALLLVAVAAWQLPHLYRNGGDTKAVSLAAAQPADAETETETPASDASAPQLEKRKMLSTSVTGNTAADDADQVPSYELDPGVNVNFFSPPPSPLPTAEYHYADLTAPTALEATEAAAGDMDEDGVLSTVGAGGPMEAQPFASTVSGDPEIASERGENTSRPAMMEFRERPESVSVDALDEYDLLVDLPGMAVQQGPYSAILSIQGPADLALEQWANWTAPDGGQCYSLPADAFTALYEALSGRQDVQYGFAQESELYEMDPDAAFGLVIVLP